MCVCEPNIIENGKYSLFYSKALLVSIMWSTVIYIFETPTTYTTSEDTLNCNVDSW
jgi:hypothetical protein